MKSLRCVSNRVVRIVVGLVFSALPFLVDAALVVGVTDQHRDADHNVVENCYVESLVAAGHVPLIVPCMTNDAALAEIVRKLDVLIFTGGADVEPARYRTPRAPKCCDPDLLRDDFEFRLLAAARARRLPIVGICRGCQLVNVGFGGTLWQDLPSEFPKGAPGFRVTAVSADGVIDGIESTDYPAFCVQFHPEAIVARAKGNAAYDHARMTKFFTSLVNLCK